jgi:hypothetical protein
MGIKKTFRGYEIDRISQSPKEIEKNRFKNEIEALALARKSKNKAAVTAAMSVLYNALTPHIEDYGKITDAVAEYNLQYANVEEFMKLCKKLDKSEIMSKPNLSDNELNQLKVLYEKGKAILATARQNNIRQNTLVLLDNILQFILNKLQGTTKTQQVTKMIQVIDPATAEILEIPENELQNAINSGKIEWNPKKGHIDMKLRKKLFEKLAYQGSNEKTKIISSLLDDPSLEAIEDPNEYAKKVFEKMIEAIRTKQ